MTGDTEAALAFFNECILQPHKARAHFCREHGVPEVEPASNAVWTVFAAILTGDRPGGSSMLAELSAHHVRSHPFGSGPTYSFVQEAVEAEFEDFKKRWHLSLSYASDLSRVELRRFTGSQWVEYVEQFGGIEFFAFSRFTDPDIDICPSWLYEHSELVLVVDSGAITYHNPVITPV